LFFAFVFVVLDLMSLLSFCLCLCLCLTFGVGVLVAYPQSLTLTMALGKTLLNLVLVSDAWKLIFQTRKNLGILGKFHKQKLISLRYQKIAKKFENNKFGR
jgi:hypothetical protein